MKKIGLILLATVFIIACKQNKKEDKTVETEVIETVVLEPNGCSYGVTGAR